MKRRRAASTEPTDSRAPLLTSRGTALAGGSLGVLAIGLIAGYRELVLVAISGLIVLGAAVLTPRIAAAIELERRVARRFVERGDRVDIALEAIAARSLPPIPATDHLAGMAVPLIIPPLQPDQPVTITYTIKALRRGVFQIGPIREERHDPLMLSVRRIDHPIYDELWVHPVLHDFRVGSRGQRVLEAQVRVLAPSDDLQAEFRTLRDYVVGDDIRRVHWASTARTGRLVVRDNLQRRRPTLYVVLDTSMEHLSEPLFEEAVEIAASLAVHSFENGSTVIARTRDPEAPGRPKQVRDRRELLELFTRVQRCRADHALKPRVLLAGLVPSDILVVVGGARSAFGPLVGSSRHATTVIRLIDRPGEAARLPYRTIDVQSAEDFAQRHGGRTAA
ncbi:MAG TPA: DUF58 domain-containing protein [Acidimicrobiales bacterium]|nr:DUF58 domain-containing protein [Acidimicrobiales bacterium]